MVDASLVMSDGRALPVRDGFVIGRATGSDLVLDDGKCSRKHARICIEGSVVEILDLDSSNGTLLNGKPVQRRVLRDGDKVQIGATVIVYREGVAAAPASSPPPSPAAAASPAAVVVPAPPPKPAVAPESADDDVDLFGGEERAAPPPAPVPARSAAPPAPVPKPAPAPVPVPARAAPARTEPARTEPARSEPVPSEPVRSDIVEFADEVVEVRAAAKAAPAAPAPMTALPGDGAPRIEKAQRVLQFSKHKASTGPLGDDLAQMSAGVRTLLYAAVLAGAGGIAWLIIVLMR
jgi:hypothetical protein